MIAQIAALVGVLAAGVVYGTDVFSALVIRPALARVDDAALTAVMGNVHRFADRRMTAPGILGIVAAIVATVFAAVSGETVSAVLSAAAFALLVVWLVLYLRISAPINRTLTAAATNHETPVDARTLQRDWDRIIVLRATLQGLAVAALGLSLFI